jgi:lysophospholipase L1-like esterase
MPRSRLRAFGWTAVAAVLVLAALEAGVRISGIAPPPPKLYHDNIYVPDSHLPYRLMPGISLSVTSRTGEFVQHMTHNSAGFRDVERPVEKPPGTLRILGIGDSFTYGAGVDVDDGYLRVLERLMNDGATGGRRVEVINAGVGGFFPEAERLLMEHYGLAYKPDIVLVGFNGTDVFESWLGVDEVRVHDGYLKNAQAIRLGYAGTFMILHSQLARTLYYAISADSAKCRMNEFWSSHRNQDEAWARIGAELAKMRDLAQASGAKVIVCFIPLQLDDPGRDRELLAAACSAAGLPMIDTTPALAEAARDMPVYWQKDGHCTIAGYRAIATAIFGALRTNELVRTP